MFEGIFPQAKQTRALVTDLITLIFSSMRGLALMRAFGNDIVRSADIQLIKNATNDLIVRHQAATDSSPQKARKKGKTKV